MEDSRYIAEILEARGVLAPDAVTEALALAGRAGTEVSFADLLVRSGLADERSIARALGETLGLPVDLELPRERLPLERLRALDFDLVYARDARLVPIAIDEELQRATVAVANPLRVSPIDDARALLRCTVEVVVSTPSEIVEAIGFLQTRLGGPTELASDELGEGAGAARIELLEEVDDAQVIRWVRSMFIEAVRDRATDIHVQPDGGEVVVRYRIDGKLYRTRTAPLGFLASIVSRLKVMSGLDIAEKRLPQDGAIRFSVAGREVDIRVSIIAVGNGVGERVVLRILDRTSTRLDLEQLGIPAGRLRRLEALIARPHGIVLVTGPTGAGKTTTLYSCLRRLNRPDTNILTAENPIEYSLAGISQVEVNDRAGLGFATCLRAFLRQDPDVIMVGEIRDPETAEVAVQAALTGHLVLSTVHTIDAPSAIPRLAKLGVDGLLLASTLQGVVAQRLVRVLCAACKLQHRASDLDLERLGLDAAELEERPALHRAAGMETLRRDGADKVLAGVTTVEEVLAATQEEIGARDAR